jgi:alpha-L-fucosidase
MAWQRDELAIFVHFGVNTFTGREWGDGREDPAIFAPTRLDARQWAHAARAAGARALVLTAKHHDGFCLWPTATTEHSVRHSPWRNGTGDVVREFVDACRTEGLRPGLYLSPWDRNNPAYGDSPRYNDLYVAQLTELLTRYGPLSEIWFDGANGEGPQGRQQVYDWPRFWSVCHRLQPGAVVFSSAGPDVRWCGNEQGTAGDPNWSTMDPNAIPQPGGQWEVGKEGLLQHGDPNGTVWRPAEIDTSIRPGWFYHPAEDERVRTLDNLVELWFNSVGRNGKLLLNVPPTTAGLFSAVDVARLADFRARLSTMFAEDHARGVRAAWRRTGPRAAELTLSWPRTVTAGMARLAEDIGRKGQLVAKHSLYGQVGGEWRLLAGGSTIGYARLHRFEPATLRAVRLVVDDAVAAPERVTIAVYPPAGT